jgi:thioredoxin-related protein
MKNILLPIILTLTLFCCTQTNNAGKKNLDSLSNSINRKSSLEKDSSSLTIFKTHYAVSMQGHKREVKTREQLSEILTNDYNRQDSLYIFIDDAFADRIEDAMEIIHNSKVGKYKVIVKNEFFKLPYPEQK